MYKAMGNIDVIGIELECLADNLNAVHIAMERNCNMSTEMHRELEEILKKIPRETKIVLLEQLRAKVTQKEGA